MAAKKNTGKKILLFLLLVLVIIQFIQPKKNLSADNTKHISTAYEVPSDIKTILTAACDDCHGNYTNYPWYGYVQPFGWWLNNHIEEGKRKLNFSEFTGYRLYRQYHKLEEVEELVENGAMPIESYIKMHPEAGLTPEQKTAIINWSASIRAKMQDTYPADSLISPKKRAK